MKHKLLLVYFVLCFVTISRFGIEGSEIGSGYDAESIDPSLEEETDKDKDGEEEEFDDGSGGGRVFIPRVTVSVNKHRPPGVGSVEDPPELPNEETDGDNSNPGGVYIDDVEETDAAAEVDDSRKEPVPAKDNSLITHPGILAAIIVGGVLVLVCLVVFFILIVCCVRRKDEGTYDLDEAMKEKLKYVAYTKAETSDKEFFA